MQHVTREQLCIRCARAPAVYLVRPHGVGYCADCYTGLIGVSAEVPGQVPA
jgi:hypothetical protein